MFPLLLAMLAAGCVERRLFVRADAPGARVFVDGAYRGRAPVEVPFAFYGTRAIEVRAPGYTPRRVAVELAPPWYQWPGLDLVTDVLLPVTIEDHREVWVALAPPRRSVLEAEEAGIPVVSELSEGLIGRGERARGASR